MSARARAKLLPPLAQASRHEPPVVQQVLEYQFKLVAGIDRRSLAQIIVHRRLDDLIEELVGLVEVGPEALVDNIDQLRERERLRPH